MTAVGSLWCRFGPLHVEYDERVLRPRRWTLIQSTWAAELAAGAGPGPLLELCAGVGHIGLAAAVLSGRDLVQIDADSVATGFAVENAARAGWGQRTEVRTARLQTGLQPDERFEVIIADPPYLRTADVVRWPDDPATAIDGGTDGLGVIVDCLTVGAQHLADDGFLLLQVAGPAQDGEVARFLDARAELLPLRRVDARVVDDARAVVLLQRVSDPR